VAAQGAHDRSAIVIPAVHALKDRDLGVIAGEGQRISPRVKMTTHRCVMRNSTGPRRLKSGTVQDLCLRWRQCGSMDL
jgi:hypothetical protein